MRPATRTDVVTGTVTLHPDQTGKPLPKLRRDLPTLDGTCPLCPLGAGTGPVVGDGADRRPVLAASARAVVVPNRWGPLGDGDDGRCELVIMRRHATHLADLTAAELAELCHHLVARARAASRRFATVVAGVNVGVTAGSSQPHLHGQVLATDRRPTSAVVRAAAGVGLADDVVGAADRGLVVRHRPGAVTWAPWAPTANAEVRIVAADTDALAEALGSLCAAAEEHLGACAYNLVIHPLDDGGVFARWLPRTDLGIVYPGLLGTPIVSIDPAALAARLRR